MVLHIHEYKSLQESKIHVMALLAEADEIAKIIRQQAV